MSRTDERVPPLRRWAWLCPIAALAIAIAIVAFLDLSFWHAALVAALLVCPAMIVWGLVVTRRSGDKRPFAKGGLSHDGGGPAGDHRP